MISAKWNKYNTLKPTYSDNFLVIVFVA